MKKLTLTLANFLIILGTTLAQQDVLISQYMFNGLLLNPAYAGSHNYVNTNLLVRQQWMNFEGAPLSALASVDAPITDKNLAWGALLTTDRIGVINKTNLTGNFAYQIPFEKSTLALGMSGTVSYNSARLQDLKAWDENDPLYQTGTVNAFFPNFGFGAYYYSDNFYTGISIPHLISYDTEQFFHVNWKDAPHLLRHYYLTSGYYHAFSPDFAIKPSFLVKYLPQAPLQADLNMSALFHNLLWVGVSYRTDQSLVSFFQVEINNQFRIGYAFDWPFNDISNYSYGSHEIFLGYSFGKKGPDAPRF